MNELLAAMYKPNMYVIKWNYAYMEGLDYTGVSAWKFYKTWLCNFWRAKRWKSNKYILEIMVKKPFWLVK